MKSLVDQTELLTFNYGPLLHLSPSLPCFRSPTLYILPLPTPSPVVAADACGEVIEPTSVATCVRIEVNEPLDSHKICCIRQ